MSVELDNDEAKMLTMMLVEDRSGLRGQIRARLAPHGMDIFDGLVDKLAGEVLGVGPKAPDCPRCGHVFHGGWCDETVITGSSEQQMCGCSG